MKLNKRFLYFLSCLLSNYIFAQPTINSFSPTSGPIGTIVTINGTNFSATAANNIVYFGAVKANVNVATATSLTVTVPMGASYQPISVTVNNLTAYSSQPFITTFSGGAILPESFVFAANVDDVLSIETNDLATADLDGDGKIDFAVVDRLGATASVYRNTSTTGTVTVAPEINLVTNSAPQDIVIVDLDGDGKLDIVVANRNSSNISVFKNTSSVGSLSFAAKTDFTTTSIPSSIAAADFDGDGKPDLAVSCFNLYSIFSVLKNTSTGGTISFAPKADFTMIGAIGKAAAGDIDGDGKPDIVFTDFVFNAVSVLRNTSAGSISFATRVDFLTGQFPEGISIGDLDLNGKSDIACVNFDAGTVSVFRNTSTVGTISFAARVDYPSNEGPTSVAIGDLDGDGKPDLVAANDAPNNTTFDFSVYKNISTTGSISFAPKVDYPTLGYNRIVIAEIDGDGKADINVAGSFMRVLVWKNKVGDPQISSFTPTIAGTATTVTITGSNFTGATAVSFGGTPATSFTVVNATTITAVVGAGASGNIVVTTPAGTATLSGFVFSAIPVIASFTPAVAGPGTLVAINGANFTGATAVSFGGTPASSFTIVSPSVITAVVGAGASGNVVINLPSGNISAPNFTFTTSLVITGFTPLRGAINSTVTITGANFSNVAANNIVRFGDVRANVLTASNNLLTVQVPVGGSYEPITVTSNNLTAYSRLPFTVMFGSGGSFNATSFAPKIDSTIGSPSYGVDMCDWDGDGKPDIAATGFDNNVAAVFRNTSTGVASISFAPKINLTAGGSPTGIGSADFDGDGKPDLSPINFPASVFKNNGTSGTISFAPRLDFPAGGLPQNIATGDLNADGKPDIVIANNNKVSILRNTTAGGVISFAAYVEFTTGNEPHGVFIGDVDNDGKPDIAVANSQSTTMSVLKNTSTGGNISFNAPIDFTTSGVPWFVTMGDINGDDKLDILVANKDANTISVFKNTSPIGVVSFDPKVDLSVGSGPRCVVLGDLNGDGKPDIVSVNSFSNSVSVLENRSLNGSISFGPRSDYATGTFPQYIAIGDLNADGKPDLAVSTYNSTGIISVLRNRVNDPAPIITSFSPAGGISGTTVTIVGGGFGGATAVSFGGVPATSFTVNSSGSITAVVATGATGNVSVTTPFGVATLGGFTFAPPPTITLFSPTTSSTGSIVTIIGTNFLGVSAVSFGGVPAQSFVVTNSTTIAALVGAGASGNVSVTTPGGTATLGGFTYIPPPTISSFTPASGSTGTVVTITGTNFTGATFVFFGAVPAQSFIVNSSTSITATVGTGASGSVNVVTPGGAALLAGFTYNAVTAIGGPGSVNSSELTVNPNPANNADLIIIKHPLVIKNAQLKFIDMQGRVVKRIIPIRNTRQTEVKINELAAGIYVITWTDETKIRTRAFVIK